MNLTSTSSSYEVAVSYDKLEKTDPHMSVQFCCPEPCEGQIYVVGAVIRPTGITFVGKCVKCDAHTSLDVNNLLKEMCNFTKGVH